MAFETGEVAATDNSGAEDFNFDDLLSDPNPDQADEKVSQDSVAAVKDEDDDKVDDKADKAKSTKSEDKDEAEELDLRDDDSSDEKEKEKDEEITFFEIPRRQEILKQYPDLFKKFPGLENAVYRGKAYREIFPTVQDAREAATNSENFKNIASVVNQGSIKEVLDELKTGNPEAFKKITNPGSYLKTLAEVDKDSYENVIGHVMTNTLLEAFSKGKELGETDEGKNLRAAAQIINKFLFQTHEIKPSGIKSEETKSDPEQDKFARQKAEFERSRYLAAASDITAKVERVVRSSIEKNIDPKGQMSDYVKEKAITDVLGLLNKEYQSDSRYQSIIGKLIQESYKDNYSDRTKSKVKDAILNKAKTVLGDAIRKVKSEALKGVAARNRTESKDNKPIARGTVATSRPSSEKAKSDVKSFKGSTLDFLNQD